MDMMDDFGEPFNEGGQNKRWKKVRERYYWKNSYEDVKKYIGECDQCQRKAPLKKASKPLRPIPVKSAPFLQIGMDLVGPLEQTEAGHWNCLFCSGSNSPLHSECSLCGVPKGHRDMTSVKKMKSQTYGTDSFSRERPTAGPLYSSNDVHHFSPTFPSYGVEENEWRILLIGKTGVGKSATGNNILGTKTFTSKMSGKSVTQKSQIGRANRFGKKLLLVDTPGIFDTGKSNEDVIKEIVKCIGITSPGLHAIILVVHIGRFTEEEKKTVDLFLNHLGQQLIQFLVVVFTRKDDIDRENTSIEEYVDSLEPSSMLLDIIEKSGRRYVAFDNTAGQQQNEVQVKRLFSVIENLIRENGGRFYTNDMYREAEMAFRRRMDEERNRLEEEKRREIEAILAPYKAEIEDERRERESLSLALTTTKEQTASLVQDKTRMEAELEITRQRVEREAAERESERRRMEEERKKDREINEQRLREFKDDSQRREEERRREYDQRQRQIEHDRRREREEADRRIKQDQEELEKRLSEKNRRKIEKVQEEYDRKMRDQYLRETTRNDVQEEKPGILGTIIKAVSKVPVIGPVVGAIGKIFKLF